MFDTFKVSRINKLTETHSEKLSDCTILMNIVNSIDAKKNLTENEYKKFIEVFNNIHKRKDEELTNSLQHRAFRIAYEFETQANIPYEKICGDAHDILYVYSNLKPLFDDAVNEIVSEFIEIIDEIIKCNDISDKFKVYSLSCTYFLYLTHNIIQSDSKLFENVITCFTYEISYKNIIIICDQFITDQNMYNDFMKYKELICKMNQQAYDNCDTLDKYIEMFTNSFLYFSGATNDISNKIKLLAFANKIKQ